jgi:hypothetical protein
VSYFIPFHLYLSLKGQAKIFYVFYRQSRETSMFLQSNGSVNRSHYFRILVLAGIDVLLTLPLGIVTTTTQLLTQIRGASPGFPFRFYYGWTKVHANWNPTGFSYSSIVDAGAWSAFRLYLELWPSCVLAIAIFCLFGLTTEARAAYWNVFCTVAKHFGWMSPVPKLDNLDEIEFGARQLTVTERCVAQSVPPDLQAHRVYLSSPVSFVVAMVGGLDEEEAHELN